MESEAGGGGLPGQVGGPGTTADAVGGFVTSSCIRLGVSQEVLAVPVVPGVLGPTGLEYVGVPTCGGGYGLSRKRGGREEDLVAAESSKRTRTGACSDFPGIGHGPLILDFEEVSVKPLSEHGIVRDGGAVVGERLEVGDDQSRYGSSSLRPTGVRKRTRQDTNADMRVPKRRSRTSFNPSITASATTESCSMSSGVSCGFAAQLYSVPDMTVTSHFLGDSGTVVAGGGPSDLPAAAPSVFSTVVTTVPGNVCVQELPEASYGPARVENQSTLQPPTLGRRARPSTHRRTRPVRGTGHTVYRPSEMRRSSHDVQGRMNVPVTDRVEQSRSQESVGGLPLYSETPALSREEEFITSSHTSQGGVSGFSATDTSTADMRRGVPVATGRG